MGRSHIPSALRNTFSKLRKLINQKKFIKGSFYYLRNTCGKKSCKCARGEKHISLYLQQSIKGQTRKILIPRSKWDDIKEMNKNYQEIQECLEEISIYEWEHIKDKK